MMASLALGLFAVPAGVLFAPLALVLFGMRGGG